MDEKHKQMIQAVATFLDRADVDFLDKLAKDSFFSTGAKVPRSTLIAWMVDILKGLGINGENVKDEKDLEVKLLEALKLMENLKERKDEK